MIEIYEIREGNGDLTEPIGITAQQAGELETAGLIVHVQQVDQYDVPAGINLDQVLERL